MMSMNFPSTLTFFFSLMNELASFDVLDSTLLDEAFFEFSDFDEEPYNDAYGFMGYESLNVI